MEYYEIYRRRLNRYGLDYQSRLQGQRERNFDNYLLKTIYRVDFWFDGMYTPGSLERYNQDHTETQCYLLVAADIELPNGLMLNIESQNGNQQMWMVWWKEQIESSGYNKYVVLKMTHLITWKDEEKNKHEQWAYFSGPGTSKITDTIKSSSGEALYKENNNLHLFITSYNKTLVRDVYFENKQGETNQGFVITETDIVSTPGVAYVSVDPSFVRDKTEKPTQTAGDNPAEFFWLNGGK